MNALLRHFPVFATSDPQAFEQAAREAYGATSARVTGTGEFFAAGRLAFLRSLALGYLRVDTGVTIEFLERDCTTLLIALAGSSLCRSGGQQTEINYRQLCLVSPGVPVQLQCDDRHQWLCIRVASSALERRLESILGHALTRELRFEPTTSLDNALAQDLRRQTLLLVQQLDSDSIRWSPLALHEVEQSILQLLLTANRHTYSRAIEAGTGGAESWPVRRLADYIEANWRQPLTAEKLASEYGADAQSLIRAFRHSRGCTPNNFKTAIRLREARKMLTAADTATTAQDVSAACGFPQYSQFVGSYLKTFGERPIETLARTAAGRATPPSEGQEPSGSDLRATPPREHAQAAVIRVDAGITCTLHNLTDEGATIETPLPGSLPAEFPLVIDGESEERYCAVIWRGRNRLGVAFV